MVEVFQSKNRSESACLKQYLTGMKTELSGQIRDTRAEILEMRNEILGSAP